MRNMIILTTMIIFSLTLINEPAPISIGVGELLLMGLPFLLGSICLITTTNHIIKSDELNFLLAILFYITYLLLSAFMGFINGVSYLNIFRSIGPYINFFPLLLLGLLPSKYLQMKKLICILIFIGLCQACYNIYLYYSHSSSAYSTLDVLIKRITLIDPRTTLPLVLACAILPIIYFSNEKNFLAKSCINFMIAGLIMLGLYASVVTLTRAIILSIVFGWLTFAMLYLYQRIVLGRFEVKNIILQAIKYSCLLTLFILFISQIESIRLLGQGLYARFYHYADFNRSDYSNGRLYDEWIPALNAWMNSGIISMFFGIGAGKTFTILSGEERTYVHNLCIYQLVYGGIFGLLACLWLYFSAFILLIKRGIQTAKITYLALAALLASIFFYGQLFAVHKDLAFNAIFCIILAFAFHRPDRDKASLAINLCDSKD